MNILQMALIFFIVTNPIGNSPSIIALIKDFPIKRQQFILFRESIFAMLLAIFFLFLGEAFLRNFSIQNYALTISGGVLLFIVAIKMIFSAKSEESTAAARIHEPFIVPIATPLLAGAGLMTMIMLYAKEQANDMKVLFAILIAWVGITAILVLAPYLQVFLGKRGLAALEQLMGMIMLMISMEMLVNGAYLFLGAVKT